MLTVYQVFLIFVDSCGAAIGIVLSVYAFWLTRTVFRVKRTTAAMIIGGILLMTAAFLSSLLNLRLNLLHVVDLHHVFMTIAMVLFAIAASQLSSVIKGLRLTNEQLLQKTGELELAAAKNAATLNSMGEGLFVTDHSGRITLVNRQAEKLLGRSANELLKKTPVEAFPLYSDDTLVPKDKSLSLAVLKNKKPMSAATVASTYRFERKDGTRFPVAFTITPILLNGVVGTVTVFRDITEEKQIDSAKSEFVSLASHQLQTPLTTVGWYAEMLLSGDAGKITPEQDRYITQIYTSNRRMIYLVRALLNVSRIEMGTLLVKPEPTDLSVIAKNCVNDVTTMLNDKNIRLDAGTDANIPILNVDPNLIRIVIQNLLTNAVKYSPSGSRIGLEIKKQPRNVLIRVTDTGYGIPKEEQPKIFTRLFRASNVRDKDPEGTGLGLYIAKAIVERSGGKIWFESEENKGTAFSVSLPLDASKKKEPKKSF